jgi:hypothetical protein
VIQQEEEACKAKIAIIITYQEKQPDEDSLVSMCRRES